MPPPYDNIADAQALIQDGEEHSIALDCAGATFENNEATEGEGWEGVWVKIDLSTYEAGVDVLIPVELLKTGGDAGYEPYMDTMKVVDASFSPASPDFTKLDFPFGTGDQYVGDGTSNPINTITLQGGTGVSTGIRSLNGIFYLIFTDWNFVGYGQATLTYTIPAAPYFSDPTVDPNTGSSTVTVGADYVMDSQVLDGENPGTEYPSISDPTVTFTVSGDELPPPGRYRVYVEVKDTASTPFSPFPTCLIRRNDFPLMPGQLKPEPTATYAYREVTDQTPDTFYKSDFNGPNYVPVLAGDVFEFCLFTYSWGGADDISVRRVKWVPVEFGGSPGPPIDLLDIPDIPAGATTFNNIPDLKVDPTESWFPCKDLCVTDNGDVYVMFIESDGVLNRGTLQKWNGTSWTLVSNDPFGVGGAGTFNGTRPQQAATEGDIDVFAIDTDGEDIYLSYGIGLSTTVEVSTGLFHRNWEIRVRKYDVSGASWSQIGSGFQGMAPGVAASECGTYDHGIPNIKISPAGVPWVVFAQQDTSLNPVVGDDVRVIPFAFRWSGSAWVDAELPEPVNPHSTGDYIDVAYIDVNAHWAVDLTFCQHDGPNENPSIIYHTRYGWSDTSVDGGGIANDPGAAGEFYYHEYDGTPGSWSNIVKFRFYDYYPATFFYEDDINNPGDWWHQGMALHHDGQTPIFAAALGSGLGAVEGVGVLKMGAGGDWVPYEMARPADGTIGIWIDPTGCDLAVDDDGNVWLCMDSNRWYGASSFMIMKVDESGTGDGTMFGSWVNNGVGLLNDIPTFNRVYSKGTTVYALVDSSSADYSEYTPTLWVMPRHADPYIPWTNASGPISMTWREARSRGRTN